MKVQPATKRVGEIEFFRAVFCLIIMIRHGEYLVGTTKIPFSGGAFAVEFFFLVSGYLMMANIARRQNEPTQHLGGETLRFVGKKMATFYPEMVVAYIIGLAFESVAMELTRGQIGRLLMSHSFEVLLLRMAGFGNNPINGTIWYLQTMILCMLILYPLIRKFPDMMQRVVMPLLGALLVGWVYRNYGNLRDPNKWIGFTFKGNVRGMAELCLGAAAYPVVQWLKSFRLKMGDRIVFTVLKWSCWIGLLAYMYQTSTKYDAFFTLVTFLAVVLAFSQQCIDAPLYQNRVVSWLGKMSLPFFLSHIFFAQDLPLVLPEGLGRRKLWAVYFGCTIVTTAIVYWGGKGIRLLSGKVRERYARMKITG